MDNALKAMNLVNKRLNAGDVVGAQQLVVSIERDHSWLPSSMFEQVLRAAVKADCLISEYSEFCQRAYGRTQFVTVFADAVAAAA